MESLETVKEMYRILNENYQDISDEANVYLFKLISDLDYQIQEVSISEDDTKAYILQEINRVRGNINLSRNIELLKFEDEVYFKDVFEETNKKILEVEGKQFEDTLNRYITVFHGLTEKDWEQIRTTPIFENEGYEEVKFIVQLWALKRYYRVLKAKLQELDGEKKEEEVVSFLHWQKKNTTEFVQFVYGLIEAGLIDGLEGERTKIVEEMALLFNFPLPDRWASNLSASINNRNADYEPEIFDKIKNGYKQYSERTLNKKK